MPDIHGCKFVPNNDGLVLRSTQDTCDLSNSPAVMLLNLLRSQFTLLVTHFRAVIVFKYNILSTEERLCISIIPIHQEQSYLLTIWATNC